MWNAVGADVLGEETRERLKDRVHGWFLTKWAGLPKTRHGNINQPWINHRQSIVCKTKALDDAGPEPFDKNVRIGDKTLDHGAARIRFQVDGYAALANVRGNGERRVVPVSRYQLP